jgi:hypothetical protein
MWTHTAKAPLTSVVAWQVLSSLTGAVLFIAGIPPSIPGFLAFILTGLNSAMKVSSLHLSYAFLEAETYFWLIDHVETGHECGRTGSSALECPRGLCGSAANLCDGSDAKYLQTG